ncbi:MAG: hypothetical protein ACREEM_07785 [Blastocatellia bacterium]
MNILDENIQEDQFRLLLDWRVKVRWIGYDIGRMGMKDSEIIPLLHSLSQITFFSRDRDFYRRRFCHTNYCLAHLVIKETEIAEFILRVLRHPSLNTRAKRMGKVIRVTPERLYVWQLHALQRETLDWPAK